MKILKQSLEYYLNLQYSITIDSDTGGGYVAQIKEKDLPGCLTQGEALEETMRNIEKARELWLETADEADDEIPLPSVDETYSGKLLLRIPNQRGTSQFLTLPAG
jgi:antitoxin HicB